MTVATQASGRGCGKLILLGEHAVVYGHTAIVAGIPRTVTLTVSPATDTRIELLAWGLLPDAPPPNVIAAAHAIVHEFGWQGAHIVGDADIPAGAGLGSSAAFCVALVKACAAQAQTPLSNDAVMRLAAVGEKSFHGTPSGVDVAAATHGCLGRFSIADGFVPLSAPPMQLVVGISGVARSTADMVARVRQHVQAAGMERVDALGALANAGLAAIADAQWTALGEAFNQAHAHLTAVGVSHPALDTMVETARRAGAIGAKLTGAGGGGSVLALAPGRQDAVVHAWQQLGFAAFAVTLGATP